MKKIFLFVLFTLIFIIPLCSCGKTQGDISVTVGGKAYLCAYNTVSDNAVFDREYAPEGINTPVYNAPANGCVLLWYAKGEEIIKDSFSVKKGERCVIPTNGCSIFIKKASPDADFTVEGYSLPEYIDIYENPSVTDETGIAGFLLSHKDPKNFENVTNAFFSPSASDRTETAEGFLALTCSRNVKGVFSTVDFDVKKTGERDFTLMMSEPYAKGFAAAFMKGSGGYLINNTEKISSYGSGNYAVIGETPFKITAFNPENPAEGIEIYDETYGLDLSPERDFEFLDIFVFDGVVAYISTPNTRTVLPYPSGYAVCFNGADAVNAAENIKVGDRVENILFEPVTTPADYVLLNGKNIVETVFRNENRTSFATAVVYDGEFFWDSTRTNIWGTEAAFDKDGRFVSVTKLGVEGKSGDTPIPQGGFVLSSGNDLYSNYMLKLKKGDTAERIQKNTAYFYRVIRDVSYGEKTESRYITVYSGISCTPVSENTLEISVDKDGYIISSSSGGNTPVPEGGYVISASDDKKQEITRFYKIGQRVIFMEDKYSFALFGDAALNTEECQAILEDCVNRLEEYAQKLIPVDYEYAYGLAEEIKELLAASAYDPAKLFEAKKMLEELNNISVPSLFVQDRSAWVVHYETDVQDVEHIVEYAHSLGINRLIVSPFRDTYALYNTQNPHLSRHPDLDEGEDMLKAYVEECHKRGMQIYFMYCCFNTVYPSESYPEEHYVNHFGDKLLLSKTGRDVAYFYDTPSYTLNPYDEEVRAWTLDVIGEVCENYDIDGIQLDYIRFPLPTYYSADRYEDHGYNADIVAAFKAKYGVDPVSMPITHNLWDKWCEFRCDIITSFAASASRLVKEYDLTFSCTCFSGDEDRKKYVFQDVGSWVEQGIIDEIYPMIYSATLEGQMKYGDEMKNIVGDKCDIILGIGTYDGETPEIVRDQVLYSAQIGASGNSVFALEYMQNFGFDTVYGKSLYRNPAATADMYGKTVDGYCKDLMFLFEKVYGYLLKEDYTVLADAVESVSDKYGDFDPSGKTNKEKTEYLQAVIAEFDGIKALMDASDPAYEHFCAELDGITASLKRLKNSHK